MRASVGNIAGRIGALAAQRPGVAIGIWLTLVIPLIVIGFGVQGNLHSTGLDISGSDANRMTVAVEQNFGRQTSVFVMLKGRRAAVDDARDKLTRALAREDVRLIGPVLEKPGVIVLAAVMSGDPEHVIKLAPEIRRITDRTVRPAVAHRVAGYPDLGGALIEGSNRDMHRFELISAPVLLLILLVIFRTPLAMLLPIVVGLAAIGSSTGILQIINLTHPLEILAMNLASVMGLALGVDYTLLLVSRFREALHDGADPVEAASIAASTAGHTVLTAGAVLLLTMVVTALVAPGGLFVSAAIGVMTATTFAMFGALLAIPAMLALIGQRINAWPLIGRVSAPGTGRFAELISRPLRRPGLAGGAVLAVMIGLSIVGLGVKTGPPDFWTLPKSFEQRRDYEAFKDEFGSAWSPPYQILVKVDHGTITDPARLKTLAAWQRQLAARPDVSSVLGPGVLERRTRALADARQSARQSERLARRSLRDQRRLSSGLARAHAGMRQVQSGLADATDGAQLIAAGGSTATAGAQRLNDGLRQARSGASRLRSGLTSARAGAEQIHAGANRLTAGSIELASGLDKALRESSGLAPGAEQLADGLDTGNRDIRALREPINAVREQLLRARQELAQLPPETRSDEHVQAALDAIESSSGLVEGRTRDGSPSSSSYGGVLGEIDRGAARSEQAAKGARSLQQGAAQLNAGLVDARDGAQRISVGARRVAAAARTTADGLAALEAGARQFDTSLGDLTAGSRQLAEGVTRLRAGADDLAARLSDGARSAAPLSDGLEQMQDGVRRGIKQTKATTRQLEQSTQLVRATRSGYMTLALIDTGDRSQSEALSTSLNVDRGGNAAVITIFGRGNTIVWGHPLRDVLEREADSLARQIDGNAYVGGAAGVLQDFDHLTSQRMIVLITLVALITWLALTFVLRTRILATIAVVLNLLTVGATFGVLVLCFQGSSPLLGGGGYIDSISLGGIFAIVFALSIDYALFLLLRMREGHDLLGSSEAAVAYGLRTTAGVVTGAATVMIGVFAAFSSAQMINLRQLGVGLVVAVLLDATLVRLVLLPTAIRLFGERAWRDSTARR